ncbi:hypothetical protein EK21DRAFT_107845 [Setomelanomma holmii]|uniref:BTB domain-containing protein n=1 Tax=Setomelanomma holmii TaxID=210430 RepID=A0A9P4HHJ9_9PLEO|nr:hypothetical protein EK21DRAFT_107845 [Setomelanomma holmii]
MPATSAPSPAVKEPTLQAVVCTHADNALPQGGFDKLASIIVGRGTTKKEFQVHRGVLAYYSTHFQHTLANSYLREKLKLPNDEPDVFEIVVYWMHSGRFWSPASAKDGKIPLSTDQILEVYFFAVDNDMRALQNATITLYYQELVHILAEPTAQIGRIYSETNTDAPLRSFVVDFMAKAWNFHFDKNKDTPLPNQFLIDVLKALKEIKKVPGSGINRDRWMAEMNESLCRKYHDHGVEVSNQPTTA